MPEMRPPPAFGISVAKMQPSGWGESMQIKAENLSFCRGNSYFRIVVPRDLRKMVGRREYRRRIPNTSLRQAAAGATLLGNSMRTLFRQARLKMISDEKILLEIQAPISLEEMPGIWLVILLKVCVLAKNAARSLTNTKNLVSSLGIPNLRKHGIARGLHQKRRTLLPPSTR